MLRDADDQTEVALFDKRFHVLSLTPSELNTLKQYLLTLFFSSGRLYIDQTLLRSSPSAK